MYQYKGYSIPDRGDHEWTAVMQTFMQSMIDASTAPISGDVYCTNVTATSTGNVYGKTYLDGITLTAFHTTTNSVTVYVTAISGRSMLKPTVTVNGVSVGNLVGNSTYDVWTGSAQITLDVTGVITISHGDGATFIVTATPATAPAIHNAVFSGSYPGVQTELKANDTFHISVTADLPFTQVEIAGYGACNHAVVSVSQGTSATVSVTIAAQGATAAQYPAQVRVIDANGTISAWYYTNANGSVDGVNVLTLNNVYPSVVFGSVTYPLTQLALKNSESAAFTLTMTNYTSFSATSPNGDLNVTGVVPGASSVYRIGGSYNVSTSNVQVTASRSANGSSNTATLVVNIANVIPVITVSQPYARLRSGGANGTVQQNYVITLSSNQLIASAPSLGLTVGSGTWNGSFSGSGASWTRVVTIADTDNKGTFPYTGISATGLSGLVASTVTTGANYVLGGFVFRTLTVPAWTNRSATIGTMVASTAKLQCTNLSKGSSGSLNYTYSASTTDASNTYSITGGNTWYNCDLQNSVSNTSGTMQIEIEEIV